MLIQELMNRSRELDRVWTKQCLADLGVPSLATMCRLMEAQKPRPLWQRLFGTKASEETQDPQRFVLGAIVSADRIPFTTG